MVGWRYQHDGIGILGQQTRRGQTDARSRVAGTRFDEDSLRWDLGKLPSGFDGLSSSGHDPRPFARGSDRGTPQDRLAGQNRVPLPPAMTTV